MPSRDHETLLLLFRNRPELAPELLRDALGVAVPHYSSARLDSADLSQVAPTTYLADLVVLLVDDKPVLGIVVEVQLRADDRKIFTWPAYVTTLRARLECPTCLLVVAPSASVADWAARPIDIGLGVQFRPIVLGPSAVPVVVDAEIARRDPELAVLSAMAHGGNAPDTAVAIAVAALTACAGLEEDRALLYSDLVRNALGEAARIAFEDLMATRSYEFQSEFARKHDAAGRAAGRAAGESDALFAFLDARGLVVSEDDRKRILACTDPDVLLRWVRRAASVASVAELFED